MESKRPRISGWILIKRLFMIIMMSRIIKNTFGAAQRLLRFGQVFGVSSAKTLNSKKRKIYESQGSAELEKLSQAEPSPEQQQLRLHSFQQLLYDCGRETLDSFTSELAPGISSPTQTAKTSRSGP